MIDPALFSQWLIAMAAIVLTPGPDSLLVMRNSANSGRVSGFATVAGIQTGVMFHTLLVLVGVTAFVSSRPALIMAIGIVGGLFIAYLAWQTLTAGILGGELRDQRRTSLHRAFGDAFLTNALNPKVILAFFAIMFPLVAKDLPTAPQVLLMSAAVIVMNSLWQGSLVLFTQWFFKTLTNPKTQLWLNRSVGLILLILAITLPLQAVSKARDLDQEDNQPSPLRSAGSALD